ncbi:zinc ribbon domain-containing protein [Ensifer soli]|uniref:zinc ribbon domain-containing protein n=1 Tax=Ciceribacter sp. sgz301302 TaxID=3342379 RepID=UPI0035BB8A3E
MEGLIGVAIILAYVIGFATLCGSIFEGKGYERGVGNLVGGLLGIFGLLIAVVLPDRIKRKAYEEQARSAAAVQMAMATNIEKIASRPETAGTKICPDCAEAVKLDARICRFCRHEFASA